MKVYFPLLHFVTIQIIGIITRTRAYFQVHHPITQYISHSTTTIPKCITKSWNNQYFKLNSILWICLIFCFIFIAETNWLRFLMVFFISFIWFIKEYYKKYNCWWIILRGLLNVILIKISDGSFRWKSSFYCIYEINFL